MERVREI